MKKYTIQLTEDELIRYYANKIIEDSLEDCSEFHYDMDVTKYEHSEFILQHKEQIIDRINKDEKVLEVYFDNKYSTFNMCFGLDWCPYYYENYDLSLEDERNYLRDFIDIELKDIGEYITLRTTRDFIRQYMDSFIENTVTIDDDFKDEIYYCLKEHICNTGFVDKYIDKYEVYVNKNNISELIEGLEKEIDNLYIKEQSGIKLISMDEVHKLIEKYNNGQEFTNEEVGKFISKENGIYLGINNSDGKMYMEDFDDIKKCINYINGIEKNSLEEENEQGL